MRTLCIVALALSLALFLQPGGRSAVRPATPTWGVLVFSKTAGFRHAGQITLGQRLIAKLGRAANFRCDYTEDSTWFVPDRLKRYRAVIFLHTTLDVLNPAQEAAFQQYINNGGGFVGIHSASNTEYNWPFFGNLVGAYFTNHPAVQPAQLNRVTNQHLSTATFPATLAHTDEWYNFNQDPATNPNITVLLAVDESTYNGGSMGVSHPISWYQTYQGGRSWYTALGHSSATYDQLWFERHLLGGILWSAGF